MTLKRFGVSLEEDLLVGLDPFVAAVVAVGYLPFAGEASAGSLFVYGRFWYFNSVPFGVLRLFASADVARIVLFGAVASFAFYQGYRLRDPVVYAYRVIALALFLSPTLYPWYVCWIVPFLCFVRSRAWLAFSGLVTLSYWVWVVAHAGGDWKVGGGVMAIEYAPFYALLAIEAYRTAQSRKGARV